MNFRKSDWVHVLPSKNSGICWIFSEQSYHDLPWKLTVKNLYIEILNLKPEILDYIIISFRPTIPINSLVYFVETSKTVSVDRLVFQTGAFFQISMFQASRCYLHYIIWVIKLTFRYGCTRVMENSNNMFQRELF